MTGTAPTITLDGTRRATVRLAAGAIAVLPAASNAAHITAARRLRAGH